MTSAKKIMNIFTESKRDIPIDWKKEVLDSILLTGTATADARVIVSVDASQILDFSAGRPRIRRSLLKHFKLILSPPISDKIQCCLCHSQINDTNYPIWYYSVRFVKNQFHYFVCFDSQSPSKPSCRCYRRDV
jgi:hypothetical protein